MALLSGDVFHVHRNTANKADTGKGGGGAFGDERHTIFVFFNGHFAKNQLWRQGAEGTFFAIPVGEAAA